MKKDKRFYTLTGITAKVLLLVTVTAFLAACAGPGNAVRVADPAKSSAHLKLQPDYSYYYDGRQHMPFTVVGLKKTYTLATKFFSPFDPDNGMLQSMIERLHNNKNTIRPVLLEIVEPEGQAVGFVFTSEHQLIVRLGADKTVYLDAPYSHGSHPSSVTGGN